MKLSLKALGRTTPLLQEDLTLHHEKLSQLVKNHSFLVIGGAGSIGQAVVKEIFKRNPRVLHIVDLSENNLVELVRDLRSSQGYISGEFKTFAIDAGSVEFAALLKQSATYDYVLNLSALKHVRSEKDPYTLMRMIDVNIFNTISTVQQAIDNGCQKYFCVSTDKAANPANMMGASKSIMEKYLIQQSEKLSITSARFANVAFSDGSLLHGFQKRLEKNQPIVAPNDVKRYFVTQEESGQICLFSALMGNNREIFFPLLDEKLHQISFADIAVNFLKELGIEPHLCENEIEARAMANSNKNKSIWPCLFTGSDTTGEKSFEEFYTASEIIDINRFKGLGVIRREFENSTIKLQHFQDKINQIKQRGTWNKEEIVTLFQSVLPDFQHVEKEKNLEQKM